MNAMPKYIVSSTLTDPEWNNTTVIGGDAVAAVTELKSGDGGPILVAGSCQLVHTLIENDLVDELRLMVFPVILGSGKRVFPDAERAKKSTLKLTDAETFSTGVVATTYQRA